MLALSRAETTVVHPAPADTLPRRNARSTPAKPPLPVMAAVLCLAPMLMSFTEASPPQQVREPRSGVLFDSRIGEMSLLGIGLRTKTFLKFKVYAIGLYVADSALSGPLAVQRGRVGTSAFYRDVIEGDFEKQLVLKLVRNLSTDQIRGSFRSHMPSADKELLAQFVSYFSATRAGQACVLRWVPGSGLQTTVAGVSKPPIASKAFADAVFAIWLGDRNAGDPIRKQMVSRAPNLLGVK